jgi:cell wall-associated NlpC family hydrolase
MTVAMWVVAAPREGKGAQSLGDKIKEVFEPTPPPKKKKKSSTKKKASPAPSPSPTASPTASPTPSPSASPKSSPKSKASPTPDEESSPKRTPTPKPSPSASPSPSKKKKKSSPTPSPSPTESPTPDEAESPSPTTSPNQSPSPDASASPEPKKDRPGGVTIAPNELTDFDNYSPTVKKIVERSLDLAGRNLTYKYGSADPASGGLDCSGFVYYVLRDSGFNDVPRDSSGQYVWVRKSGTFQSVISKNDDSFELAQLKPGDLLFWTGTYDVQRDPPITHAMIYLGKEKSTGRRVMVGASDGRVYRDQSRFGVSIFDFKVSSGRRPTASGRTPTFVGYGRIPGLGDG